MFLVQVLNEAGFPLFIHAKPHLFSMKNAVFICILASTADEDGLFLTDLTFTLIDPIRGNSLFDSSSLRRTQMRLNAASCQSVYCDQLWPPNTAIASSHRVVVVVD